MVNVIKLNENVLDGENISVNMIGNDFCIPILMTKENKSLYIDTYLQLREDVIYRDYNKLIPKLYLIMQSKNIYKSKSKFSYFIGAKVYLEEPDEYVISYQPIELQKSEEKLTKKLVLKYQNW